MRATTRPEPHLRCTMRQFMRLLEPRFRGVPLASVDVCDREPVRIPTGWYWVLTVKGYEKYPHRVPWCTGNLADLEQTHPTRGAAMAVLERYLLALVREQPEEE